LRPLGLHKPIKVSERLLHDLLSEEDQGIAGLILGPGRHPPLDGKVLEIKGIAAEIAGKAQGIEGAPKEIQANLKELRAKVTETEIRIELSGDVLFDFDKHTLRKDALASLEKLGQVVKGYGGKGKITVEGFTDAKGKDAYNLKLSARRAESVKEWLVFNAGVPAARIAARGLGKANPVAANTRPDGSDNPDGRQKNRRVEIVIKKE